MAASVREADPALPTHARRRGRRRRRRAALFGLLLGVVCAGAGLVLIAAPLWSGWLDAAAQHTAARHFAAERAAAVGGSRGALGRSAPGGGATTAASPPRTAAKSAAAPAAPVGFGHVLARLRVRSIGLDAYVLQGLTFQTSVWQTLLRRGPAHLQGSALPGQTGDVVIFGHVNIWGSVFQHLHRLRPGTRLQVETPASSYTYVVTGTQLVTPTDTSALRLTTKQHLLQLVTCSGLWDTHRLIVTARLAAAQVQTAALPGAVTTTAARSLVTGYERALGRAAWGTAYAAWGYGWQAGHTLSGFIRGQWPPVSAQVMDAWPVRDGRVRVVVREELPLRSGVHAALWRASLAPTGPGSRAPGYAPGTPLAARVIAFTVGRFAGAPQLLGARVVRFRPLDRVTLPSLSSAKAWAGGQLRCGSDVVRWRVGSVQAQKNDGFTFAARPSSLKVDGPSGQPLTGIDLPGLSQGTYPVACGDLGGDGGTALVLRTLLSAHHGSSDLAVYRLGATQASLIGQMVSAPAGGYPRLTQPQPYAPYTITVATQSGGKVVPQVWTFSGGRYRTPQG